MPCSKSSNEKKLDLKNRFNHFDFIWIGHYLWIWNTYSMVSISCVPGHALLFSLYVFFHTIYRIFMLRIDKIWLATPFSWTFDCSILDFNFTWKLSHTGKFHDSALGSNHFVGYVSAQSIEYFESRNRRNLKY